MSPSALALYKQRYQQQVAAAEASSSSASASVFKETPLSPTEMADNLRDELKRMKKRRQLVPYFEAASKSPTHSDPPSSPEPMEPGTSAAAAAGTQKQTAVSTPPKASTSKAAATPAAAQPISAKALVGTKDKPVFTLKQMSIICERMCQVQKKTEFLLSLK